MNKAKCIFIVIPLFISCTKNDKPGWLASPDSEYQVHIETDVKGAAFYSIESDGKTVIDRSRLGLDIRNAEFDFSQGLVLTDTRKRLIDETYTLPTGKTSLYINRCNEKEFHFRNMEGNILTAIFRAYDDGVAFRYQVNANDSLEIVSDLTEINLASLNSDCWIMDYIANYEGYYPKRKYEDIMQKDLSYPALVHLNSEKWILVTEAAVYDEPASHLRKETACNLLTVKKPEGFITAGNYLSPWHVLIMGDDPGTIFESIMVENLNPTSELADESWIDPGVAVFPWWGNYQANSWIDTLKMYVDLAAAMDWEWIEFDVSIIGSTWRTSKEWRTTGWISEFTSYAESKGIKVYGWDEIGVLDREMDYVFGRYRELGIRGIKIDYIDSDDAFSMRFRDRAMREAARYQLHVSFHGETVPRGQRRRYPNVMTLEGVRGAEYYTFRGAEPPTPAHNTTLPFTRNVVGPMDYTPATFTIREENPRITSYAHELALPIIFESGWMTMADRPAAYLNSPAREMLKQLKAT